MHKEIITFWVASDGSRHKTEEACLAREQLLRDIEAAMQPMGTRTNLDSHMFIQHTKETLFQVRRNLLKLIRPLCDWESLKNCPDDDVHPSGGVGRFLDDVGGPLSYAWWRLRCSNFDSGREYEQPFFALNEHEFTPKAPEDEA